MGLIVLNHVVSLGGTLENSKLSINSIVSLFYLLGGKLGTNVFVILGIYFLSTLVFKSIRIVKLWSQS
ncbi:Uncharacterised protein [Streptococcus equinus]|nr:Uncharacterised protein [Streptococcus equinus]